jgi:hypothetical protein
MVAVILLKRDLQLPQIGGAPPVATFLERAAHRREDDGCEHAAMMNPETDSWRLRRAGSSSRGGCPG